MTDAFATFWRDAVARTRPRRTLIVGPGEGGLAGAVLALTAPWAGLVDLAWPRPAPGQPPLEGDRFTVHVARPQDATGLLPVPNLVLIDADGSGEAVTGVLEALRVQTRRLTKPFPLVLLFEVMARRQAPALGEDPRPPVLAALEEFVAAAAPALVYAAMPLMGGAAVLAGRDEAQQDDIRGLVASLAMGGMARWAAEAAEAERQALLSANDSLRKSLGAAEDRALQLAGLLRQAQAGSPKPAAESPQERPPARLPRRIVGKMLTVAGWRNGGAAAPPLADEAAIARLRRSPLLVEDWYMARYPDVAAAGMEAAEHYYRYGAAEGRDPGPDFVTAFYLENAPDAALSGSNPLLHFLDLGGREGRNASPHFDAAYYLATYADVAEAGLNPLEHFVAAGRAEGRRGLPPR
jgi:hypothetical protein